MTVKKAKEYLQGAIDALNSLDEDDFENDEELQELYDELAGYFV